MYIMFNIKTKHLTRIVARVDDCTIYHYEQINVWFKLNQYWNNYNLSSNQEIIKGIVTKHPGLRFHEIKKEAKLANGTLQHHLSKLESTKAISIKYTEKIPRYYSPSMEKQSQVILLICLLNFVVQLDDVGEFRLQVLFPF